MSQREGNGPDSAEITSGDPDAGGESKEIAVVGALKAPSMIRFREQREMESIRANSLAGLRSAVFKAPVLLASFKALDPNEAYRVELPRAIIQGLRRGDLAWDKTSGGLLNATVRNIRTGKIEKQVRLRPTNANLNALKAMNELAVHTQLGDIVSRLEAIDAKLDRLLDSVRDDRYGKIDAGLNLYHLGLAMDDPGRRQFLLLQALPLLAEGRAQLLRSVRREMEGLVPPTSLELFIKATPFIRGPQETFVDRFKSAAEDTAVAMGATRAMVVVLESCGEWSAAQLAVDQLVEATREFATEASALEAHIPSSKSDERDSIFWKLTRTRLVDMMPPDDVDDDGQVSLTAVSPAELLAPP